MNPNRNITATDPNVSLACTHCHAPLGTNDKRCPFCGHLRPDINEEGVHYPQFEAAKIGMSEINLARKDRPLLIIQPKRPPVSIMTVFGGVILLALAGYGGWNYLEGRKPSPAPSASAALPPIEPEISSVSGLDIPDAHFADPSILLPKIQRTLFPQGEKSMLVRIQITGSSRGAVDLTRPETTIVYTYREERPIEERGESPTNRSYELRAQGGGATTSPANKEESPIHEPNCTWTAAWHAAVQSGIPNTTIVNGLYEKLNGEPRWRITVPNDPKLTRDLDGMTCVIKQR